MHKFYDFSRQAQSEFSEGEILEQDAETLNDVKQEDETEEVRKAFQEAIKKGSVS